MGTIYDELIKENARLREENERLKASLTPIEDCYAEFSGGEYVMKNRFWVAIKKCMEGE